VDPSWLDALKKNPRKTAKDLGNPKADNDRH